MKVTIELPDTLSCAFVNYVFIDGKGEPMMGVKSLCTDDLDVFRKGGEYND